MLTSYESCLLALQHGFQNLKCMHSRLAQSMHTQSSPSILCVADYCTGCRCSSPYAVTVAMLTSARTLTLTTDMVVQAHFKFT